MLKTWISLKGKILPEEFYALNSVGVNTKNTLLCLFITPSLFLNKGKSNLD